MYRAAGSSWFVVRREMVPSWKRERRIRGRRITSVMLVR